MSNMHRITWFDQQLRAKTYPTRERLAEKFEISIRQAQRDIDYLKNSLGAPLNYDAKKRGYYYEDETFVLPNIIIGEDEKKMLGFLAYKYTNYNQTPKVAKAAELFKKLTDEEQPEDELPIFDIDKPIVHFYYSIYNAIKNKMKLQLLYRDAYRGEISIVIHPYKLFHQYKADYLVCYSQNTDEVISLRLDRILELGELNEKYEMAGDFEERKYSSFVKKDPFTARIKFIKKPDWSSIKGIHAKEVEALVYEVEFYDVNELVNSLINMNYWEQILSPKWLKREVKKRCEEIISKVDN
ncbi:MAG: transcriptional regulator protein-like protein [Clostridia bacterium]|nr:transcriptional regulator protein-like protein [Clostridia bacterium]